MDTEKKPKGIIRDEYELLCAKILNIVEVGTFSESYNFPRQSKKQKVEQK